MPTSRSRDFSVTDINLRCCALSSNFQTPSIEFSNIKYLDGTTTVNPEVYSTEFDSTTVSRINTIQSAPVSIRPKSVISISKPRRLAQYLGIIDQLPTKSALCYISPRSQNCGCARRSTVVTWFRLHSSRNRR